MAWPVNPRALPITLKKAGMTLAEPYLIFSLGDQDVYGQVAMVLGFAP